MSDPYAFNLRWYNTYVALVSVFAWVPVFSLYFSQHLDLSGILMLEGIYFLSVVAWEIPSGYIADRLGRKKTMLLASVAMLLAYLCFYAASQVSHRHTLLVTGQILFAVGIASLSGADTAFHYESLLMSGREAEYDQREATVQRVSFASMSLSALAGGLLGSIKLELAYALSACATLLAIVLITRFVEPRASSKTPNPFLVIKDCIENLKTPQLGWFFAFSTLMYVLAHVPYEFYQPYLKLLSVDLPYNTAIVSGVVTAATMALASYVSGKSMVVRDRLGLRTTLFLGALLTLGIIGLLGSVLHVGLLAVILCRNAPMALARAPMKAAMVPLIDSGHRATFLSLLSVCGRLSFAVLLFLVAKMSSTHKVLAYEDVSLGLRCFFGVGAIGLFALFLTRAKVVEQN